MTEAVNETEWLTCADPEPMLDFLRREVSDGQPLATDHYLRSTTTTDQPRRCRCSAEATPTIPAPSTITFRITAPALHVHVTAGHNTDIAIM